MVTLRQGAARRPVSAAARDRYVLIETRPAADAVEPSGLPSDAWAAFRSVYMARRVLTASERLTADQVAAASETRWEMEYLEAMDPELVDVPKRFRLVYGGRPFNIVAAEHVGRRRAIALVTLESSSLEGAP